jgi:hypothetical protein
MKKERDIEKEYTDKEFVAKLRRLADSIEQGKNLKFKLQVKEFMYLSEQNTT